MTLLGSVLRSRNSPAEDPAQPLTSKTLLDWMGIEASSAGKNVNQVTALGLAAVWRALHLTTSVPASLPFAAYKADGGARVPLGPASNAQMLMSKPHPDMTPFEFWQLVHVHRKAWGNAYLRKLKSRNGQVVELWPIHPARVKVGRVNEVGPKVYQVFADPLTPSEGYEVLTDDEVLHLPGMGYDGICGVSPIRAARESIGLGLAAQEFGGKLFGSGSLATGILQTEQRLSQEDAERLKARWRQSQQTGLRGAHDTVILDNGAKFERLTIPPGDAQFLESRRFQVTEVCRWFGLPPFLMFETETSTSWGTGLEQQALAWVKFDLMPDLVSVEQRVSSILYPQPAYAKHNVEGLLRGDSAARASFYTAMWNIGALSTNEIRAYEEMAPVEGGDFRYRPLNMGALGTAEIETTQTPTEEVANG